MADTIRTESALQALFPSGTGGITAQSLRDFLVSVPTLAITAGNASSQRTALGLGTMATAATSSYAALAGAAFTGAVTIASGTLTASAPALAITQTWNGSGVQFNGIFANITNTLSASSSLVLDLQINSVSRMSLDAANGKLSIRDNGGSVMFQVGQDIGIRLGTSVWTVADVANSYWNLDSSGIAFAANKLVSFSNGSNAPYATKDVGIGRNAAGVVEINNGTAGTYRDLKVRYLSLASYAYAGTSGIAQAYFTSNAGVAGADMGFSMAADGYAMHVHTGAGSSALAFRSHQVAFGSDGEIVWTTGSGAPLTTIDLRLYRSASKVLCLVDGSGGAAGLQVSGKFGANAATPQAAYASGGALSAYATGVFGFDSDAHASEVHALVVKIRAALVANGIMS